MVPVPCRTELNGGPAKILVVASLAVPKDKHGCGPVHPACPPPLGVRCSSQVYVRRVLYLGVQVVHFFTVSQARSGLFCGKVPLGLPHHFESAWV